MHWKSAFRLEQLPGGDAGNASSSTRGKILVVEDDASAASFYEVALKMASFDVMIVTDRNEAAEALSIRKPDVIVMDYWMQGMSASVFLDRVRRVDPKLPVVLITAQGRAEFLAEILHVTSFLGKPFDGEQLVAAVEDALKRGKGS